MKWIVLLSSTFVTTFVYGFLFCFGSLITDMLEKFLENRSKTALVQGIVVGVASSTGVLSGILVRRLGLFKATLIGAILSPLGLITAFFANTIGHLYVCIGIITGFGISVLFVSSSVAVGFAFDGSEKLLALAIQNAGTNVAGIVLPYFFRFTIGSYGLNGSFLLLGGIHLNCFIVAILFHFLERANIGRLQTYLEKGTPDMVIHASKIDEANQENETLKKRRNSLMRIRDSFKSSCKADCSFFSTPYILNLFAVGFVMSSSNGFKSLLLDILEWKSMSSSSALLAFPIGNCAGLIARLFAGILKQCKGVNSLLLPTLFSLLGCCGQIIILIFQRFSVLLIGCGLAELATSGVITAGFIVVVQLIENGKHLSVGFGLINSVAGLLSAAMVPAYGAIRDESGSYGLVIILTLALHCLGACLFVATGVTRKSNIVCYRLHICKKSHNRT